jgi:outer membrane protein assembly factor BamB
MKRNTCFILGAIVGVGFCTGMAKGDDWAAWRGTKRDGFSNEKNVSLKWAGKDPTPLWKANVGKSYSAVVVQQGRLYTMGDRNNKEDVVFCFDANTGNKVWEYAYPHIERKPGPDPNHTSTTATPIVSGKFLYTVSREGYALCLDTTAGKMVWERELHKEGSYKEAALGYAASPLLMGERLYYNVGGHGIALDKVTGKVIWKSTTGQAGHATPIPYQLGSQKGIAFFNGGGLVGVNAETGSVYWEHKWKTQYDINAADPIFLEDGFFITAFGRAQRVRVQDNNPTVVYESKRLQSSFISPVKVGNYLYGNGKGRLMCMDLKTGEATWDLVGMGSGALIANRDRLLVLMENGELVIARAKPDKCEILARGKVMEGNCWMQPILANGKLYCRNVDGELVCVDVNK